MVYLNSADEEVIELVSKSYINNVSTDNSGGFRNSERGGSAIGARSASANLGVATPTSGHAGSPN